jgi:hypothetical protein
MLSAMIGVLVMLASGCIVVSLVWGDHPPAGLVLEDGLQRPDAGELGEGSSPSPTGGALDRRRC